MTENPIVDMVRSVLKKQFEGNNMPYHLFELEDAARKQEQIDDNGNGGWNDETITAFILKWCRKYNGEYAEEDVALALRTYGIDPHWLEDVANAVSEEYGGAPIYTAELDPRNKKLYEQQFKYEIHSPQSDEIETELPF